MKPLSIILIVLLSVATCWTVVAQTQKARPSAAKDSGGKASEVEAAKKPKAGGDKAEPNALKAFMRLKLEHSQRILEGLALEDFGLIKQHAQKLGSLALDETWQVLQTREYHDYSAEFQQISGRLSKSADDKNLDGAALGYVQLTLNCVNCHKHVRDEK
jgi:cytochrome c556